VGILDKIKKTTVNAEKAVKQMSNGMQGFAGKSLRYFCQFIDIVNS
jgi:hypothetical protein